MSGIIIRTTGAYCITAGFCAIIVTTFHPTSGGPVCMQSSLDLENHRQAKQSYTNTISVAECGSVL